MVYRLSYYRYRYNYIFKRLYRGIFLLLLLIFLIVSIWALPPAEVCSRYAAIGTNFLLNRVIGWDKLDYKDILISAMPLASWAGGDGASAKVMPKSTLLALLAPIRGELGNPAAILKRGIPLLAMDSGKDITALSPGQGPGTEASHKAPVTDKVLVGIYHTHTSETYALSDGSERLTGQAGGVVLVGRAIKQELEQRYGIKVAHSERVNDTNYSASYGESEKNARQLLEENPDILIMLDVHRDAGKSRENCLVKVNGQEVAPLLFVVGSDARATFPAWRQNLAQAEKLHSLLQKKYPGLSQGVRVKEGRYNQYLHPGMLLVEVGSVNNYTSEAEQSARMLADVLADMLGDMLAQMPDQATSPQAVDITNGQVEEGVAGESILPENEEDNLEEGNLL